MHRWFEAGVFLALVALLITIGYVSEPHLTGFTVDEPEPYVHPEVEAMLAQDGNARVIVEYRERVSTRDLRSIAQRYRSAGVLDRDAIERLREDRSVKALYPDVQVSTRLDESLGIIDAAGAQAPVSGGSGTVCVIDTGVDYTHPGLGGCSAESYSNGSCRIVSGYDFVNDDDDPMDDEGHGTHVASIVSAVAPNSTIVAIKSLDSEGSGWLSDVMEGVEWCRANADAYNISVISMSLGGSSIITSTCDSYHEPWNAVLESAVSDGLLVVSATGNTGSTIGVNFPACVSSMIRVGATDKSDAIAPYTNRGPAFSDIVLAPGSMIEAARLGGGTIVKSGTSMATPHVSGVLALMASYAASQNATIDQASALAAIEGVSITDDATNMSFVRIDARSSLVTFDVTAPSVSVSESNGSIVWNASDDLELDSVNVTISHNGTLIASNTSPNGTFTVDEFGTYRFDAVVNDTAGNTLEENVTIAILDTPNLSLRVNDTSEDLEVVSTQNLTINATLLHGEAFELFVNGSSLSSGNASYVSSYRFEAPGTYTVFMRHNATDVFEAANVSVVVEVLDGSPIIANATPSPLTIMETSEQTFWVNVSDPLDAGLAYAWTVGGSDAGNASDLTINGSIGIGNHTVAVNISNAYGFAVQEWNFTVTAVPPTLSITPSAGAVELAPNTSRVFSAEASDPLERTLAHEWRLDEVLVGTGTNHRIHENATDNASNLTLIVTNGNASANATWTIVKLAPLAFETSIENATWREDEGYSIDLSEHFSGITGASFTLNATEFSMGVQGSSASFSRSGTGSEEVVIIASRNDERAVSNAFLLSVTAKPASSGGSGGSGGGSSGGSSSSSGGFGSSITHPEPEPAPLVDRVAADVPDAGVRVEVKLARSSRNATVSVREVALPDSVPAFERAAYKTLEARLEGAQVGNATISFSVDPEWVVASDLNGQDVALYRFNGSWQELETEFIGLRENTYRYVSNTPGFSYFTIGARSTPEPVVVEIDAPAPVTLEPIVEERNGDGFAIVLLVLGLVALAVFSSGSRNRTSPETKK